MEFDKDELLLALYSGIYEEPVWETFLEKLRVSCGALYAHLTLSVSTKHQTIKRFEGIPTPEGLHNLVFKRYEQSPLYFPAMTEGRIYSLEALCDPDDPTQLAYYQHYLHLHGIDYISFLKASDPNFVYVWLGIGGRAEHEHANNKLLSELVPHLRVAARIHVDLEQKRESSVIKSEVSQRLNFSWLILDEQCRVVEMMPNMEQFLRRGDLLKAGADGQLIFPSSALNKEIKSLIKHFAKDATSPPRILNVSHQPGIDMLVAPIQHSTTVSKLRPVAVVYLRADHTSQENRYFKLIEKFGLLPSEAKLAWTLVQGMSIAEAARHLGITEATARSYSKQVFSKTGAHGQTELVRMILTSVMALNH